MHDDRDHVISIVLSHAEWQELVKLQPQPSAWLRARIDEMLGAAKPPAPVPAAARVHVV